MITCTFAGHREAFAVCSERLVAEALEQLLKTDTEFRFFCGGMGAFDGLCTGAVREARRRHPELRIRLVLVLPYVMQTLNDYKVYYESRYDDVLIPAELMGAHHRKAVSLRNRWMVDRSDYLLCCVRGKLCGGYDMLCYARRRPDIVIRNLADE